MTRKLRILAFTATLGLILAGCGDSTTSDPAGEGDERATLVVGSQQYYSNEIIAELFAQSLENAGFEVDRQYQIGQREVYMPEVEAGTIDVFPEYSGNLLQYLDPTSTAQSPADIAAALTAALPDGIRALPAAGATDQDSFNVTAEFAATWNLTSIGDLANVDEPLKIAANSEFEIRPYGPSGLAEVYGVVVNLIPIEDGGGPLTVQALLDGTVQVADIYSASPAIAINGLVTLDDPKNLVLPQNVTPLVSERVDDAAIAAIAAVTEKLTTQELVELNRRSVDEQAPSADIARTWLAEQGIVD